MKNTDTFLADLKTDNKLQLDFLAAIADVAKTNGYDVNVTALAAALLADPDSTPRKRPVDKGYGPSTMATGEEDNHASVTTAEGEEDTPKTPPHSPSVTTLAMGEEDSQGRIRTNKPGPK